MGEQIVQVRIPGARRTYPYTWDGEPLEVGDWVDLPGNAVSPDGTEGRVEGFGADDYTGPMKAVVAAKEKQDPWMARMRQVRTRADALKVYRRAQKAGITGDRLAALVETGKRVTAGHARDYYREKVRSEAADYDRQGESADVPAAVPPLTSAEDAAEHRARAAAGSIGRVDAGSSEQQDTRDWGEWE